MDKAGIHKAGGMTQVNRMPGYSSVDNLLQASAPKHSVLIVEPNPYHGEILPGFAWLFQSLGYNVDVLMRKEVAVEDPFVRYPTRRRPGLYAGDPEEIRAILTSEDMARYETVFFSTNVWWEGEGHHGAYLEYLGAEPHVRHKPLFIEHNLLLLDEDGAREPFEEGRVFTLLAYPFEGGSTRMANPHFFGRVHYGRRPSQKRRILVIGSSSRDPRNLKDLFNVARELLSEGVDDFMLSFVGADVEIPKDLRGVVESIGRVDFARYFRIIEESDYLLTTVDLSSDDIIHRKYANGTTTGTVQISLGFRKPMIIDSRHAGAYGFDNKEAIVYDEGELLNGLRRAIIAPSGDYKINTRTLAKKAKDFDRLSRRTLREAMQQHRHSGSLLRRSSGNILQDTKGGLMRGVLGYLFDNSVGLKTLVGSQLNERDLGIVRRLIQESRLFDKGYYEKNNKDVVESGMDPLQHFIQYGGVEGRSPSKAFDSEFYLAKNIDVRETRVNPLLHYLLFGKDEGRGKMAPVRIRRRNKGSKKVDIINVNFYDLTGKILYKGGAERYVYDLAQILKDEGYEPRILQNSTTPFRKNYRGIPVEGVVTGVRDTSPESIRVMSKAFDRCCVDAALVIASPIDLACEINSSEVIGISHGIHWDTVKNKLSGFRQNEYAGMFDALANVSVGICVDTNFINWTRTYDYAMAEKLRYIPNYYDKNAFVPTEKDFSGRLHIMYPRRLYDARGIYITLDAFNVLLKRHKDIRLMLVGQTDDLKVKKAVAQIMNAYPKQVTLEEYEMQDMYKAYRKSNVVLIPTRYAEGTSLSALEAMATNNVVVATNVGGLPNLIIDGYNGLLIDPSADALVEAVEKVASDRNFAGTMAQNALLLSKSFEKRRWDVKWRTLLKEVLQS